MFLYNDVYNHYLNLIRTGVLKSGDRMPSLRKAASELSRSRTTIESAYFQLAADGYIIAKPQSGYYVTELETEKKSKTAVGDSNGTTPEAFSKNPYGTGNGFGTDSRKIRFDFASSGVDRESFRFDLWQRYIKSALRQGDRLLTYGEPQGEADFRESLAAYVRDHRNILCSHDQIVVGAGVQSLLHMLCPLLTDKKTVSFPTPSFIHGASVFQDHGFQVHYRDKDADVVYVSPAHMNRLGDIMPVKRRMELIRYAKEHGSLIIEDDYENEFVYLQKPTPSLYGLSKEPNVIYIGSFSRLLLPSIRISFMVLPFPLMEAYRRIAANYNQTASKAEQIALSQFIRDGHLAAQTRKLRRLYAQKQTKLSGEIKKVFGPSCTVKNAPAGTMVSLTIPVGRLTPKLAEIKNQPEKLRDECRKAGIRIPAPEVNDDSLTLILSCSSMPEADFEEAVKALAGCV